MLSNESLQFLQDLKENNNRDWFQNNKSRYEKLKKEYHQLIATILEALIPHDSSLNMLVPKDCAFRINRDIRFSKDKTPYKTHLGIWITPGGKKASTAGYYIHIEKDASFVGGGFYVPTSEELQKIRREIAYFHDDLEKILTDKNFIKQYETFDREESLVLKNPPKGYDKEHPAIEHLKLKSFTATKKFDSKLVQSKNFIPTIIESLITLKPLNDFLNRALFDE